jgi:hypothetical protein
VKTRGRDADGEGLDRPHYTQEAMERVPEAACRYNNMEKSINRDIRMLGAWVPQVDDSIKGIQQKLDTIGNRLTTLEADRVPAQRRRKGGSVRVAEPRFAVAPVIAHTKPGTNCIVFTTSPPPLWQGHHDNSCHKLQWPIQCRHSLCRREYPLAVGNAGDRRPDQG